MTTTPLRRRKSAQPALATPRQARSQAGLAKMLQVGRELIEASGNLDDLSINSIVEQAGTSIGAFYRRFDNKDVFFDVVQDMVLTDNLEYLRDLVEQEAAWQSNDAGTIADAVVDLYVQAFRDNRGLYHASLLRSSQRKTTWDAVKQTNEEALKLIVPRLVAVLGAGRRMSGPRLAALEFEVRVALQFLVGMLVNSLLNDPGPLSLTSRKLVPSMQTHFRRSLNLQGR
ncbi:TetR/AcrR family transcriptional regulator [Paraburkholderia sediminicola]|uniref:TetR/AcrR family transcriptional regulator n=1 Tax=Paraburkholderia sediminicola TaxID=458836 RepID=UPI0038B86215